MDLENIEKAIDSLQGFKNSIGIMGGEPTKHPEFVEICELIQKKVPKQKRSLFTSGHMWTQYQSIIRKTFGANVHLNTHKNIFQKHHPMLLSIKDLVSDDIDVNRLTENCWVDQKWSASINQKGCFFCEIAAALDLLFEGPGGMPIKMNWWKEPPSSFASQKDYCYQCGACVPFRSVFVKENIDYASISNFERLKSLQSPRFLHNRVKLVTNKDYKRIIENLSENWEPWSHRGEGEEGPCCYDLYGPFFGFKEKYTNRFWHVINRMKEVFTANTRIFFSKGRFTFNQHSIIEQQSSFKIH